MLGSDILGVQGYFVNATSNAETTQNPGLVSTATTYLVAAGAPAFDPNCQSADVATAVASGCSTVSTFNGCGTGCGVNPTQEALWAGVGQGQFGTYNTTLWQR